MQDKNTNSNRSIPQTPATGAAPPALKRLEKFAFAFAAIVVGCSLWYWSAQVGSVLEILEMAYG